MVEYLLGQGGQCLNVDKVKQEEHPEGGAGEEHSRAIGGGGRGCGNRGEDSTDGADGAELEERAVVGHRKDVSSIEQLRRLKNR